MDWRAVVVTCGVALLMIGCGSGSSDSSTVTETTAAASEDVAPKATPADYAAIQRTFKTFLREARDGNGEAACAVFTASGRKAWEDNQAEPLVIQGRVVERPTPEEVACENSVLETIFAKFPFDLRNVTIRGVVGEGVVYTASKQGIVPAGTRQENVIFAKENGTWKIALFNLGG